MRRMLKCYDMSDFGRYRYNMSSPGSEWFWGEFATDENIEKIDRSRIPNGYPADRDAARDASRIVCAEGRLSRQPRGATESVAPDLARLLGFGGATRQAARTEV